MNLSLSCSKKKQNITSKHVGTYVWRQCARRYRAAVASLRGHQHGPRGEGHHVENVCRLRLHRDAPRLSKAAEEKCHPINRDRDQRQRRREGETTRIKGAGFTRGRGTPHPSGALGGRKVHLAGGGVSRPADRLDSGELIGVRVTEEISRQELRS